MKSVNCPACGSGEARSTGAEVPGFAEAVGSAIHFQEPYSVVECMTCYLLYKTQTLSPAEFADYYARVDHRRWGSNGFYPTERRVMGHLRKLQNGLSILDVGCSTGRLLAPFVASHRCVGIEPNASAANEAERRGIEIYASEEALNLAGLRFEAVVMTDVFEHLTDPSGMLARLLRLLKPGGLLIIASGNGDSSVCREDPAQFWYFRNVEHVSMITRRHAEWMARHLNLRLVKWDTLSHYDCSIPDYVLQWLRHRVYFAYRRGGWLLRAVISCIPIIRRVRSWPVAPKFCATSDHVVAVFETLKEGHSG